MTHSLVTATTSRASNSMHPPGGYVVRISAPQTTVCLLPNKALDCRNASLAVFPALLLSLVLALTLALLGFLRGSLALRPLVLALLRFVISMLRFVLGLRLGRFLFALGRALLGLLTLTLGCRTTLLRRRLWGCGLLCVPVSPLL
jgi:hypothetical protein